MYRSRADQFTVLGRNDRGSMPIAFFDKGFDIFLLIPIYAIYI